MSKRQTTQLTGQVTKRSEKLEVLWHSEDFKLERIDPNEAQYTQEQAGYRQTQIVYRQTTSPNEGARFILNGYIGRHRRQGFIVDYSRPSSVRVYWCIAEDRPAGLETADSIEYIAGNEIFSNPRGSYWSFDELILLPFMLRRGLTESDRLQLEKWGTAKEFYINQRKTEVPTHTIYHKDGREFTRDVKDLGITEYWKEKRHRLTSDGIKGLFDKLQRKKLLPASYYKTNYIGFDAEPIYKDQGNNGYMAVKWLTGAYREAVETGRTWEFIRKARELGLVTRAPIGGRTELTTEREGYLHFLLETLASSEARSGRQQTEQGRQAGKEEKIYRLCNASTQAQNQRQDSRQQGRKAQEAQNQAQEAQEYTLELDMRTAKLYRLERQDRQLKKLVYKVTDCIADSVGAEAIVKLLTGRAPGEVRSVVFCDLLATFESDELLKLLIEAEVECEVLPLVTGIEDEKGRKQMRYIWTCRELEQQAQQQVEQGKAQQPVTLRDYIEHRKELLLYWKYYRACYDGFATLEEAVERRQGEVYQKWQLKHRKHR